MRATAEGRPTVGKKPAKDVEHGFVELGGASHVLHVYLEPADWIGLHRVLPLG